MRFQIPKIGLGRLANLYVLLLLSSCSVQKQVPEGQIWLKENKVQGTDPKTTKTLAKIVRPVPNPKLLGVAWQTQAYLLLSRGSQNKIKESLKRRIGSEPVYTDTMQQLQNAQNMRLSLANQGFFQAKVNTRQELGRRGAVVVYEVQSGSVYTFGPTTISGGSLELRASIDSLRAKFPNKFPVEGNPYQAALLGENRSWLVQQLREAGYFRFGPDFVEYLLDSTRQKSAIHVNLNIIRPKVASYHQVYRINKWAIDIGPATIYKNSKSPFLRTYTPYPWLTVTNEDEHVDSGLIVRQIKWGSDLIFSESKLRQTQSQMAKLGLFTPGTYEIQPDDDRRELDIRLKLNPLPKWTFRAETELSTNSIALFGLNGVLNFTRRNAVRLGDLLILRLDLGAESQQLTGSVAQGTGFNTMDIGVRSQLSIPGIIRPGWFQRFNLSGTERTQIALNYQRQKRQDFDRNVFKANTGFTGQIHSHTSYEIYPVEVTYANTGLLSQDLKNLLSQRNDPFLTANFASYLSTGLRAVWVRNRLRLSSKDYLRLVAEGTGNSVGLINFLTSNRSANDSLLGLRYFRYLKTDAEWRHYFPLGGEAVLATRVLGSFGLPLGNQATLPLEKRTFAGGTNSIRAWPVRGLGPGSISNYASGRLIQFGEIRLETNAEWRFKVLGPLHGAVFVDAGNIWTLSDTSSGGAGNFKWSGFLSQIAVSQGVGLRFDVLGFFVMRVDFALKLRDPALVPSERWVVRNWLNNTWKDSTWRQTVQTESPQSGKYPLFSTVFGINFPF